MSRFIGWINRVIDWIDRADRALTRALRIANAREAAGLMVVVLMAIAGCGVVSAAAIIVRVAIAQLPR